MSGDSKQTSTTSNQPYKAATPLLDKGMGDALSLYNSGGLVKPNTQSTVVPYAQQTSQGMAGLTGMAGANSGGSGLSGQYQGIINNGGYNADQMSATGQLRTMSGSNPASGTGQLNDLQRGAYGYLNGFAGSNPGEGVAQLNDIQRGAYDNLNRTANSSYDMNANPGFAGVLRQAQEGSMYGSNANAAGMGRYGSGAHQGVQQRELGDLTSRMVGNDYNQWLGRMDSAVRDVANIGGQANNQYEADMARKMGSIEGIGQLGGQAENQYEADMARKTGATTGLFNAGQQGQANIGNAYDGMRSPFEDMFQVGSMNEDLMGRFMNDSLRINQEKQNAPLANLQALLAAANGAGGYGNTTQTAQGPSNTFSNIAGGLLGGGSLLGSLF